MDVARLDIDEYDHIKDLAAIIAKKLQPLKIYLFGSFAEGRNQADSDYDFYIVMPDSDTRNPLDLMTEAQRSLRHRKKRPVDVLVGKQSRFEKLKNAGITVESDIAKKGVVIYG